MKYSLLIISNLILNSIFAQTDSLKKNNISLEIEVGAFTSIFLNNYSQNNNFTADINKPFTEYTPPHTIGFRIQNKSKYFAGLHYCYFDKSSSLENGIQGDVVSRFYHAIVAEIGKSISFNKFSFSPTFYINYKTSGIESVILNDAPKGWGEPHIQSFQYNSLGFGLGGSIKYYLLPNLYISTDLRFTHNFENNNPLGKPYGGFEEFYKNYRVNQDAITASLNIGYQIKIRN